MTLSRSIEKVFLINSLLAVAVGCSSASPLSPDGGTTGTAGTTEKTGRGGGGGTAATSQGTAGASGVSGMGGASGTVGARTDAGADALAACAWPASLDSQDAGAGACRPAHALLSCAEGQLTELCLSDDPTKCSGEDVVPSATVACHDLCGSQEFAVACGSVGVGLTSDPPAGCHGAEATPAGIVFFCCPCGGGASGDDGGATDAVAAGRTPQNHRASNAQCLDVAPAGDCSVPDAFETACHTDSQCTSGLNGRCENGGGGPAGCYCSSDTCTRDDVCKGGPCACHGSAYLRGGNACMSGNCQIDSDCGAGGFCSPSVAPTSCFGLAGYYCHTRADQCTDDSDCNPTGGSQCMYDVSAQRWQCQQTMEFLCPV